MRDMIMSKICVMAVGIVRINLFGVVKGKIVIKGGRKGIKRGDSADCFEIYLPCNVIATSL